MGKKINVLLFIIIILSASAGCFSKTKFEQIPVNYALLTTMRNANGQPEIIYSEEKYPVVEYLWDGTRIKSVVVNYYIKNTGESDQAEIAVTVAGKKKKIFEFKPNTSYIIRAHINQFGITGPWNSTKWVKHTVKYQVGSLRRIIAFEAPQGAKRAGDKVKLLDFDISVDEMDNKELKVEPGNLPDQNWFHDTVWVIRFQNGSVPLKYIRLYRNGSFGYNTGEPRNFYSEEDELNQLKETLKKMEKDAYASVPDPSRLMLISMHKAKIAALKNAFKWEIKDERLILHWNSDCRDEFKLTSKDAPYFLGFLNKNIPGKLEKLNCLR